MEQVIKHEYSTSSESLAKNIQTLTTKMNKEGFKLTALSCTAETAYSSHAAILVFTKE